MSNHSLIETSVKLPKTSILLPQRETSKVDGQAIAWDAIRGWEAIRIIGLPDRAFNERSAWLEENFTGVPQIKYADNDTTTFSSFRQVFDLVLIHGSDVRRLGRIVKTNLAALSSKGKIAALSRSWPADRAYLLNSGFDDVIDQRMSKDELEARLWALWRRRQLTISSASPPFDSTAIKNVSSLAKDRLTNRELEFIIKLNANIGNPVPSYKLANSSLRNCSRMEKKSLQVFVCRLRKKLRSGVLIECISGHSYRIVINDAE